MCLNTEAVLLNLIKYWKAAMPKGKSGNPPDGQGLDFGVAFFLIKKLLFLWS